MNRIYISIIDTLTIILIVPIIGFVIGEIVDRIIKVTYRNLGKFWTMLIANRLTFIGTVHHELSHAIFAFITGAKIIKISLFYPQGDTLGKVIFQPRGNKILQSVQLTLSAIAPVIMGTISVFLLCNEVLTICTKPWQYVIIIYLIISILLHTTMSIQDIKNAIKGLPVCSIIIFIICYLTNFNVITIILK